MGNLAGGRAVYVKSKSASLVNEQETPVGTARKIPHRDQFKLVQFVQ